MSARSAGLRALVVDDDAAVRYTLRAYLEEGGFDTREACDGLAALAMLDELEPDLLLTDLRMPGLDGLGLLARLRARDPADTEGPVVLMITAHGSERDAVAALRLGAFDYVPKPFEPVQLELGLERARAVASMRRENRRLRGERHLGSTMVFASDAMRQLAGLVARVGPRDVTVLITGETGTGKERVAEALVAASPRADRPFVRFNCAALGAELVEAELFGHARGAFTGAHRARTGLLREAEGGTVLLDEVGELDLRTQAKLLRVIQAREVRPVGEERAIAIDVRLLAATHRDLGAMVAQGTFREDLYYRLKVVELHVPPLRERRADIAPLARFFAARAAARFGIPTPHLDDDTLARLAAYPWPGNARELENALESAVALADGDRIGAGLLPGADAPVIAGDGLRAQVDAYERGLIVASLRACGGNRSEAARRLGIARATLHEKLARHGLAGTNGGDDR